MLISWVAAAESLLKLSCLCLQNKELRLVTEPSLQHTVRRQENMEASRASLCPSQGLSLFTSGGAGAVIGVDGGGGRVI